MVEPMADSPPQILFVDDDRDLCDTIRDTLGYLGIAGCVLAQSLEDLQAQRANALTCRLAIVDINLGLDVPTGVDVYDWLRREGFKGEIVFLTGHGNDDPRVVAAAQRSGARILSKPIDFGALAELVGQKIAT
jgi:FixJ family two-component response regulator